MKTLWFPLHLHSWNQFLCICPSPSALSPSMCSKSDLSLSFSLCLDPYGSLFSSFLTMPLYNQREAALSQCFHSLVFHRMPLLASVPCSHSPMEANYSLIQAINMGLHSVHSLWMQWWSWNERRDIYSPSKLKKIYVFIFINLFPELYKKKYHWKSRWVCQLGRKCFYITAYKNLSCSNYINMTTTLKHTSDLWEKYGCSLRGICM